MTNSQTNTISDEQIIKSTEDWLVKAVIGLNLCPFAKPVHLRKAIRFVVSKAHDEESVMNDLADELIYLSEADSKVCETTLLILPKILSDFVDFNDFMELADQLLEEMDLTGTFQIANFHPFYQFAGTEPNDIENYTNRSPYPILHLIREASIEEALKSVRNPDEIFENNISTMKKLGHDGWRKLMMDGF